MLKNDIELVCTRNQLEDKSKDQSVKFLTKQYL